MCELSEMNQKFARSMYKIYFKCMHQLYMFGLLPSVTSWLCQIALSRYIIIEAGL